MKKVLAGAVLATAISIGAQPSVSQPGPGETMQEVRIVPGWNAVLIQVDANAASRSVFLARAQIEKVAVRNPSDAREEAAAKYAIDVPEWSGSNFWIEHVVVPKKSEESAFALNPGTCVMLRSKAETAQIVPLTGTWTAARHPKWRGIAGTLVGIGAVLETPTTVDGYFGHAADLLDATVYALTPESGWRALGSEHPVRTADCLFVRTTRWSDYAGPIEVTTPDGGSLRLSPEMSTQPVRIRNRTDTAQQYTLEREYTDGEAPTLFAWNPQRAVAGNEDSAHAWEPIEPGEQRVTREGPARGTVDVLIAADLSAPPAHDAKTRRTVLWIGTQAMRIPIPVTVEPAPVQDDVKGLWVGDVEIDEVDVAANGSLEKVAHPFTMRMIVHASEEGECRLLSQASVVEDKNTREKKVLIRPPNEAEHVLQRTFSIAYVTDGAVPGHTATGESCLTPGAATTFRLVLDYRHLLNPDVHATHPDHDNRDETYRRQLSEGAEARTIVRRWTVIPDTRSAPQQPPFVWGNEEIAGRLEEQIDGLYREGEDRRTVHTAGRFRLRRVSHAQLAEWQMQGEP